LAKKKGKSQERTRGDGRKCKLKAQENIRVGKEVKKNKTKPLPKGDR